MVKVVDALVDHRRPLLVDIWSVPSHGPLGSGWEDGRTTGGFAGRVWGGFAMTRFVWAATGCAMAATTSAPATALRYVTRFLVPASSEWMER